MADVKVTALPVATSADVADVIPIVTDVATVPISKKITFANLAATLAKVAGQVFTGAISATNLSGTNTGDQDLSGLVPTSRTVNGQALSSDVTLTKSDVSLGNVANVNTTPASFGLTVDGAGSVLTTGSKGFIVIPYACTITDWYVIGDVSGSIVIDLKRSGSTIVGAGNKPTLSAAQRANAAADGSWTDKTLDANDEIEFNIDSVTTLERVNLIIKTTRT